MKKLNLTRDFIVNNNKDKLKDILSKKTEELAFQFLINKAENHSKVNVTAYTSMEGAKYLSEFCCVVDYMETTIR